MTTSNDRGDVALTLEERREAQTHWLALMPAASQLQLDKAREALRQTPSRVQEVVSTAMFHFLRANQKLVPGETPFD